jgi:hypothetical protein
MKAINEWTTEEIRSWIYAIGERSDRVISRAMDDDDWSEYESDERLYSKLEDELIWERGIYPNGQPIDGLLGARVRLHIALVQLKRSIWDALPKWMQRFISDNPSSEGQ